MSGWDGLPGLEGYAGRDLALGQWDTEATLARAFVRWVDVRGLCVLEPSCGIGNIMVEAAKEGARRVIGVEISEARAHLARERMLSTFVNHDVLTRDVFDPGLAEALRFRGSFDIEVSIGNSPFEKNGVLRHVRRWLDFSERAAFVAPLETLAGARDGLWDEIALRRVAVCAPGRPPFGLDGHGMSEIAFFEVRKRTVPVTRPMPGTIERLDWRALGAP